MSLHQARPSLSSWGAELDHSGYQSGLGRLKSAGELQSWSKLGRKAGEGNELKRSTPHPARRPSSLPSPILPSDAVKELDLNRPELQSCQRVPLHPPPGRRSHELMPIRR